MLVIVEKMAMLVILLALGYLCAKLKLVGPEFNKGLSKLVIDVFLVGMILSSVINKDMEMSTGDMLFGLGMLFLMSLISLGVGILAPALLRIRDGDKGMYRILVAFMNNAFMGYPIVAAVYGEDAVFFASLSNIPFNILLYTIGIMLLQGGSGEKLSLKKIITVPVIATLIATLIFAFNIRMPTFVEDLVSTVGDACVPLSMMSVGLSLGNVSLKEAFTRPRIYGLSFLRLLVVPVIVWAVLRLLVTDQVMLGTIVIMAACPSAVICAILGIDYGRDGAEASEVIFISTVLSMFTIPLLISVLGLN